MVTNKVARKMRLIKHVTSDNHKAHSLMVTSDLPSASLEDLFFKVGGFSTKVSSILLRIQMRPLTVWTAICRI